MTVPRRQDIRKGQRVRIVLKRDQRTGERTEGTVERILTRSPTHPHGIKVRLADGRVGRVKETLADEEEPPMRNRRRRFRKLDGVHLVLIVVALASSPSATPRGADGGDVPGRFRQAFRPLRIRTPAALGKELQSSLPSGIVVESGPFDAIVTRLLKPLEPRLKARDEAAGAVDSVATGRAATLLRSSAKVLAKEARVLARAIAAVEADYGDVYNRGYMESGEEARRTRKLAAVLVPFYRTLQLRQDGLRSHLADSFARLREGSSLAWLAAEAVGAPDPMLRAAAVEALGRIGGDPAQAALRRVTVDDADSLVRVRALHGLTAWKVSSIRDAILKALEDPAWEVRALAIRICARANLVAAAGPLISALEKEDGRLRTDIDEALGVLVGVRMHADVALWRKWWTENAESVAEKAAAIEATGAYEKPVTSIDDPAAAAGDEAPGKAEPERGTSFYGITTTSKRIAYVVDISRSMASPADARPAVTGGHANPFSSPKERTKMSIARWQLHRAVHDLPQDARFNIIVYSESCKLWRPEMVEARARARAKAHRFVDELVANGTTNIGDSLDRAFQVAGAAPLGVPDRVPGLAVDTIFLLSDGVPNRGRVTNLEALLEEITERNRTTRIVIHAIGIGEAAGSTFLKELARRNGGRYAGFR